MGADSRQGMMAAVSCQHVRLTPRVPPVPTATRCVARIRNVLGPSLKGGQQMLICVHREAYSTRLASEKRARLSRTTLPHLWERVPLRISTVLRWAVAIIAAAAAAAAAAVAAAAAAVQV